MQPFKACYFRNLQLFTYIWFMCIYHICRNTTEATHDVYNARIYGRDVVGYCHLRLYICCRHHAPGQELIPLQRLHVFAHSRGPYPAIHLWCQVPSTKSKTIFQIETYCVQCFLKSKYIKSRTFNDNNRWIIKKVMVPKKLFPHLATRGTYSPGDWRCDEAWREQTLVYPPVMCQQRLSYLHMRIELHAL